MSKAKHPANRAGRVFADARWRGYVLAWARLWTNKATPSVDVGW